MAVKYNQQSRIKGAMRQVAKFAPEVKEALNLSVHPTIKGPRGGAKFTCAKCGEAFDRKEVQVDHKDPVIPVDKRTVDLDWNTIVERMFCSAENYQVLCKPCHVIKSNDERKERKKYRDDIE